MIEQITTYGDNVLKALGYFTKNYGLVELVSDETLTYPAKYCTNGKYKHVSDFAKNNGSSYWRLLSAPSVTSAENTLISGKVTLTTTYIMRLVVCIKKTQLPSDNEYSVDNLLNDLVKNLSTKTQTLKANLNAKRVEFNPVSFETGNGNVFSSEYIAVGQDKLNPKYAYGYIDFNILVVRNRECIDDLCTPLDDCDVLLASLSTSDKLECILPTYDFSDSDTQNATTAQQQTDLTTWLCGAPPQKTYYRFIPHFRRANSVNYDVGWYLANADAWTPQSATQGLLPVLDSQDETKLLNTIVGNTNAFGNYERFTNDVGGIVTDGSDGSTPLYLIDHLTGKGYRTVETLKNASNDWHTVALNAYNYSLANVPDGGNYTGWRMIEYNDIAETFIDNGNTSLVFTGTSSIWIMNTINVNSGLFMRRDRAVWASTLRIDDASLTATNLGTLLVRNHY